jgi:hypothetical protein
MIILHFQKFLLPRWVKSALPQIAVYCLIAISGLHQLVLLGSMPCYLNAR